MALQIATTGQLDEAQRIAIAQARFTAEHNDPCVNTIEKLTLKQGEKSVTVPKVAQMEARELEDGVDLVDSEDIGMTTVELTTGEVGLKVILTDKLVRQENESVFRMVGRQMGDAKSRKEDTDVIALFSALNGGTVLGEDGKYMTLQNIAACLAHAKSHKFPRPISIVHHPNAVHALTTSLSPTAGTYPIPSGLSAEMLKDFWAITIDGVAVFHDGNIGKLIGYDSGYGAIYSKNAMCIIRSKEWGTERERDASLRATELVMVADYGCFELDDGYGAPMQYEIGDPSTSN